MVDARAIFRAGNERIGAIARRSPGIPVSFICECDDDGCLEPVPLTADQYDALRTSEDRYVVTRGHEYGDALVEQFDSYAFVERPVARGEGS